MGKVVGLVEGYGKGYVIGLWLWENKIINYYKQRPTIILGPGANI